MTSLFSVKDKLGVGLRLTNMAYDIFALTKNVPLFVVSLWPELLQRASPTIYNWAEHLLQTNRFARFGKLALELYLGSMIGITFIRLSYWITTREVPPSLPEYPVVASKWAGQAQKRISAALSNFKEMF